MIDQFANSPVVGIVSSRSFSSYFCCHLRHSSFPHNVPSRTTQHNNQFGVEAAEPTALMLEGMLIVTLLGRHRRLPGTLPYIFLRRAQLTTTPQRPLTRCDLDGRQRPPWCPTPDADAQSPSMLADCRMRWRQEWGTMAAVGQRRPPRLAGHGLASFS